MCGLRFEGYEFGCLKYLSSQYTDKLGKNLILSICEIG